MNYKKLLADLKRNWILSAVITCAFGLVLLLFPNQALTAVTYTLGFLAVVMGVIRTVRYFKQDHTYPFLFQSDLVVGLMTVGLGLFMITQPQTVLSMLPHLFGILLVGCGVGNILRAVDAKKAGIAQWGVLLALAIISIVLGWLIICNPFGVLDTLVAIIGAGLIFEGVTDIVTTLWVGKRIDAWKKTM